jgi:hypothetical protein
VDEAEELLDLQYPTVLGEEDLDLDAQPTACLDSVLRLASLVLLLGAREGDGDLFRHWLEE